MSNNNYLSSALEKLHSKNEDFILIGLTGRTGSGCTTAAKTLASSQKDIQQSLFIGDTADNNQQRKQKILHKYFKNNWQPFIHLKVSSVLTMMLLENPDLDKLRSFLDEESYIRQSDTAFLLQSSTELKKQKNTQTGKAFYIDYLSKLTSEIRTNLEEANFIELYQKLGKNARRSGSVIEHKVKKGEFYSIAEVTKNIITDIHEVNKTNGQSTYIAIDAIRNPLEASYFQERYASFYLLAVSCDEETRQNRLKQKGLSQSSIDKIDESEYSDLDLDDAKSFTDQDIQGCLQRADIYVDSNATDEQLKNSSEEHLANQLIKFVCLAQKPGLITPSAEERCMQMAYTAKLNSGCLSRQVGAVVTKNNFSIKAVGWNDAPYGQVPCNLRNVDDLQNRHDKLAYSPFELTNEKFRNQIESKVIIFKKIEGKGYNHSYCFKSEYNKLEDEKNQVHTRSLHAEENAFLQVSKDGGSGIEGGFLFTTASPCELCAKKAYQLGMTKIFYIDPYPGISMEHILSAGPKSQQPTMVLFNGAIGRAFHNLYTPIASYKDELHALIL
ncbi:deoxycytidylate deaminase [Photobacterium frigidiphilum]|uniref:deoxycytidylate deaminase n=1 Tax=Photobacterium frigidiphilum TaxID=264736 RepID=UPI003D09D34B